MTTLHEICFICGCSHSDINPMTRHDIIPKRIVQTNIPINFRIMSENKITVCERCHRGIHNAGRLLPGTPKWNQLNKSARKVRSGKDFRTMVNNTLQTTVIEKLNDINLYHEFLEYKYWVNALGGLHAE